MTSSATFSDLQPATTYIIQVRANNTEGVGPWSTSISVTTDPASPGIISFTMNETTVSEAGGSIELSLLRTMGGFMSAKCYFTTVDGTAVAGVQYVETSGEVDFNRSTSAQSIVVSIINNAVTDDPDKYFFVSIQPFDDESGEIGDNSTIKVTILDDGDAGTLAFGQINNVSESVATLTVKIIRTGAFSGGGDIAIDTVDTPGGAVAGIDYNIQNSVVSFTNLQKEAFATIEILNDAMYQVQKTFQLTLRAISGRISGTSELSDVFVASTKYLSIPDEAQNIVALSRTGGSVTLSWTPPFDFGGADITAYDVSFFLG
ncbi:hypothetical protein PHYSODRAFT_476544, partial [Phytophthora sojae]